MTQKPSTTKPTSRSSNEHDEPTQHHHDSTAQTSYQPRPKIKNRTAHPRIEISRKNKSHKHAHAWLILKWRTRWPLLILEGWAESC
jgi:heat shock protein HslJ